MNKNLISNNTILLEKVKYMLNLFPSIDKYKITNNYLTNYYNLFLKGKEKYINLHFNSMNDKLNNKVYNVNEYSHNSDSDIFNNIVNLANFGASGIIFHYNNINIKLIFTSGITNALENEIYIPNYLIELDNNLSNFIVDIKSYEKDYEATNIYYNLNFFILNIQYCFMMLSKHLINYIKDNDKKIVYGTSLEEKIALKELKSISSHITEIINSENDNIKYRFSYVIYCLYKKYLLDSDQLSLNINLFNKIDKLINFLQKIKKYQLTYYANIIISEKAISNALFCYIFKNNKNSTPIAYKKNYPLVNLLDIKEHFDYIIFCTIITLIQAYYATNGKFTHGDLKIDNLLIYSLKDEIKLNIKKYKIRIRETYVVKLNDFDLASIEDHVENIRLKKIYTNDKNMVDKNNSNYPKGFFYDMHYFIHFLHKYKKNSFSSPELILHLDNIFDYAYCNKNPEYCSYDRIKKYFTKDISILENLLELDNFSKWVTY
jgi:hypothetical protein